MDLNNLPDELNQEQFFDLLRSLRGTDRQAVLVDTIANPLPGNFPHIIYSPPVMKSYPEGTIFVMYCDTGKASKERLPEFRKKLPGFAFVSLRGGRGYWRESLASMFLQEGRDPA